MAGPGGVGGGSPGGGSGNGGGDRWNRGSIRSSKTSSRSSGPNVFLQAGALQSAAATEGADAEIEGLKQAIAQLQQMIGQSAGDGAYSEAGLGGLEGVVQGSSAEGFDDRLNSIISGGSFNSLVDLRRQGVQGQLGAGGLTRSGTAMDAMAAIPADMALQLENQLFGRQAGLADMGFQSDTQDIGRDTGLNAQIAALLGAIGTSEAAGITGAAEAKAGGILGKKGFEYARQQQKDQNSNDRNSALFGAIGTGVGAAFGGPVGAGIGGAIGSSFSDPRLKTNVKIAGQIGPLDLVTWDWTEEAKGTIAGKCKTFGFMSNQVKEHFPEFVSEYGGFDVVNYRGLVERLNG